MSTDFLAENSNEYWLLRFAMVYVSDHNDLALISYTSYTGKESGYISSHQDDQLEKCQRENADHQSIVVIKLKNVV